MLLLSDADRTEAAASLLPDVLHMLATTHADLGKYRRAAEYFNRALAACNTIYGKGHVRCCPVLRGWARMAVRRQQDHTLAAQLLRKEKDVREAHMGRDPSADERAELVSLLQELAALSKLTSKTGVSSTISSSASSSRCLFKPAALSSSAIPDANA